MTTTARAFWTRTAFIYFKWGRHPTGCRKRSIRILSSKECAQSRVNNFSIIMAVDDSGLMACDWHLCNLHDSRRRQLPSLRSRGREFCIGPPRGRKAKFQIRFRNCLLFLAWRATVSVFVRTLVRFRSGKSSSELSSLKVLNPVVGNSLEQRVLSREQHKHE